MNEKIGWNVDCSGNIVGVWLEPGQFTAVVDGKIHIYGVTPHLLKQLLSCVQQELPT